MKYFKSILSRFRFFHNQNNGNQQNGTLAYLKSKLQAISFFPGKRDTHFRLIAPNKEDQMGLPGSLAQNISQISSFNNLTSISQINAHHSQNADLQAFQSTLQQNNYQLLFKGAPPLNLKVIEKWSDLPVLAPIKDVLSKHFGENLSPLEKVVLPSILSGENHVIQQMNQQATNMMFLIPAFMYLLQVDPVQEEKQVKVLILAKDETQVENVNSDITQLQTIFSQGYNVQHFQQHILIDTPKNLLANLKENKISLKCVKYFVVSDLTAMQDMGYAEDIVAVNSFVNEDKQTVIVSEKLRNDYLVIDSLMANFKIYIYVLSQYAQVVLEDYALKASLWTIILLMAVISYLTYKLNSNKEKKQK